MAGGTEKTVIYMIVVLLALAEQVIATVAGNAPVVSAWAVRLVMRRGTLQDQGVSPNVPRTLTQRFWPDREGKPESPRERRLRRWKRGSASDPYPITITTTLQQTTASEEALDPTCGAVGDVESRRSEAWELTENATVRMSVNAQVLKP